MNIFANRRFHQVAMLLVGLSGATHGLAQEPEQPASRYRFVHVRGDRAGLSLHGGAVDFEPGGVFGTEISGRREVGGWSGQSGWISSLRSQSVGAGTRFDGIAVGPLLVGTHVDNRQVLPIGLTVGVQESRSSRSGGVLSLITSSDSPPRTLWVPPRPRYGAPLSPVAPLGNLFFALHGGVYGGDEVSVAHPPTFAARWTTETHFFVPEGPTFDSQGNAYFTPYRPETDTVILVSVDGATGARRFAIPGSDYGQGGAPLILNNGNGQVVYTGGAARIVAVDTATGAILWEQTGLPEILSSGNGAEDENRRLMGINYHAASDSLIAAFTNGFLIALNRETGAIKGSFDLPGSPSPTPQLPEEFFETYGDLLDQELAVFDVLDFNGRSFAAVLLGGNAVIPNYFSIDPNTGRLWVGGTLADEVDGTVDGVSEFGALFGIDVTGDGDLTFSIVSENGFQGGSASTAALRPDGERVYIADGATSVRAYNRSGQLAWSVDVGAQVVGAIAVSSFGEIYAATAGGITKIQEVGESAEIEWQAGLDSVYKTVPTGWQAANINLTGIGANGVMVQTSVGPPSGFGPILPVRMSVTLLDAGTGLPINSTQAVEESVSTMSTGPDGEIVLANSPVRRVMLRVLTAGVSGQAVLAPPLLGGLTKYDAVRQFDLLARDASFAAVSILQNASDTLTAGDALGAESGLRATRDLIAQTNSALQRALRARELPLATVAGAQRQLALALEKLNAGQLTQSIAHLQTVSDQLNSAP
jgi:hypothetical protein